MTKKISIVMTFDKMKENIKQGEKWIRDDWKQKDKYVILADDRYIDKPCLLLVYVDTDNYIIFHPTYKDYNCKWRKVNG